MKTQLFVNQIWQKDNDTFSIQWNDGQIQDFKLSHLQRYCPCAQCTDEYSGKSIIDPRTIQDDVKAIVIRSVGRYGLKIQFTAGCSNGIYSFSHLRELESP